jgi:hypothetical protein
MMRMASLAIALSAAGTLAILRAQAATDPAETSVRASASRFEQWASGRFEGRSAVSADLLRASAPFTSTFTATPTATAGVTVSPPISATATMTGTISLPDLMIPAVTRRQLGYIGCVPPWPTFQLSVTVGNIGLSRASAFVLRVASEDRVIEGLDAGETKTLDFGWNIYQRTLLYVDADDAVRESDESNNAETILPPPPPSRPPPCPPTPQPTRPAYIPYAIHGDDSR